MGIAEEKASRLAHFIESLPGFELETEVPARYEHVGAIVAEAALQAGINYNTVVRPRTESLLASYPEAKTTSEFQRLLMGVGATHLLTWKWDRKINTVIDITLLLVKEGVETVDDLHAWLLQKGNVARLKGIHGVGDKTADLFKIMVGISASAIDRHIYAFLAEAGVPASKYQEAQETLNGAANLLGVSYAALDQSVWRFMMARGKKSD
jgi:hypothetical protein